MMWVVGMVAASLTSCGVVALLAPELGRAVFLGMIGPLLAVAGTAALVERTARANPAGVASVMMAAFVGKMLFFGLYVVAVVTWADVENRPFLASFTAYFLALYATEALHLRRVTARLT